VVLGCSSFLEEITAGKDLPFFSRAEVAKHNSAEDQGPSGPQGGADGPVIRHGFQHVSTIL